MDFKTWFLQTETPMFEPFPTKGADKNPYINGKWSTSAFQMGRAKVRKNPVADQEEEKKKDDDATGFHL